MITRKETNNSSRKRGRFYLIGFLIAAALFWGSSGIHHVLAITTVTYEKLKIFSEVYALIQQNYVEEIDEKEVLYGAVQGMLKTLDPHSSFLTPEHFNEMRVETHGEFGGLGIEITRGEGAIKVVSPIEDTPAYHAGMQPGDLIVEIEGETTKEMTLMDAVRKMRGKPGEKITLTVIRKGGSGPLSFTITRAIIKIQSVKSRMEEAGIGYIRIIQFNEQTFPLLQKAIKKFHHETGEERLKGLVLDLRNDPGGLLDQAVKVSDAFLNKGRIVYTKGRIPGKDMSFSSHQGDISRGVPIVILINGGSASASEIVAGALQDHHRAILMGTTSFGKGSVQTIIPLSDGSGLRLTTAKYYTPKGRSIQAKGIEPDIVVEDLAFSQKKTAALHTKEADLKGHLQNGDEKKGVDAQPDAHDEKAQKDTENTEKQSDAERDHVTGRSKKDYQLQRALDLLKGYQVFTTQQALAHSSSTMVTSALNEN